MNVSKAFAVDTLERFLKTFLQAFAASLVVAWSGSSLDVQHLNDWSAWQKILVPAVVAGLAAVGSLLTSLLSGLKTGTASASPSVAATAVEQSGNQPPVTVETPAAQLAP